MWEVKNKYIKTELKSFFSLTDVLPVCLGLHQRMQTQTFVWTSKHF